MKSALVSKKTPQFLPDSLDGKVTKEYKVARFGEVYVYNSANTNEIMERV